MQREFFRSLSPRVRYSRFLGWFNDLPDGVAQHLENFDNSHLALLAEVFEDGREIVTHGFRSTFRTWAAECTNFPWEVAEAAIAHVVGDDTEQAYQRGDLFEKRRRLMAAWADYCVRTPAAAAVVS